MEVNLQSIVLGGGCFWGLEQWLLQHPYIHQAVSGYAGGDDDRFANPTYRQICWRNTGHAEVVRIDFDADKSSLEDVLEWFFRIHDPTQINRQGPDRGSQYRSIILAESEDQLQKAQDFILEARKHFTRPIATQVQRLSAFWPAEEYHQRYFQKMGLKPGEGGCHYLRAVHTVS